MPAPNIQSSSAAKGATSAEPKAESAVNLLKADHRKVESLFAQCEKAEGSEQKAQLAKQICKELIIHTLLEEEIFYPACRDKNVEHEMLDEAQVEHDSAKILIGELLSQSPDDEFYGAKVTVLSEYIKHHVGEEEKARNGIFAAAQKAGVDMNALGQRIQARKQELMAQIDENRREPPQPRSLHPSTRQQSRYRQEDYPMARQSYGRERDEYGRFMSDDDDDRRGGRRGGSSYRERDEQGRFMSDDDDYRGSRSSRGRNGDYDDDRQSSRGSRGQGGWFGDPEGHSEAARRGRSGGSRYEDDDDYRGSRYSSRGMQSGRSSSRYEDEDERRSSRGGRGQGGWFGDPEGHAEASRRGWRTSEHEGSGWYGDPEGHSEASQRGWEGRGSSRGGRQSSSRYEDDDDDRRSSRGRGGRGQGQGGWFGDPEGHSEASRRGWRNRD
jgi:hemerythrin superfamily protein